MADGRVGRRQDASPHEFFEVHKLTESLGETEFAERERTVRQALLETQSDLLDAGGRVVILFGGVDGAGKEESANLLSEWLDPRLIHTHAFADPEPEALVRPYYWRFWTALPPAGQISVMLSAWYHDPLLDGVYHSEIADESQIRHINQFEQMLTDDGVLLLKFWMHLGKEEQREQLEQLERDPLQRWRTSGTAWRNWARYDDFVSVARELIVETDRDRARWRIIDGSNQAYRSLAVAEIVQQTIAAHLEGDSSEPSRRVSSRDLPSPFSDSDEDDPRASLDYNTRLPKKTYRRRLSESQARLNGLYRRLSDAGRSLILVFEGWDAAGKGGTIRRVTHALNAQDYDVIQIAAPTAEEKGHHYLWRFWRRIPRDGKVTIFDRSWYGRILVERVEGFASEQEWQRAFGEINYFEEELVRHGIVLGKVWLDITAQEQQARFEARADSPFKRWKLTEEDWRNRAKWDEYEAAVSDMLRHTSNPFAP
ncbi:MAG: polyphosphate:AMP phosphotransferase, partial [Gemmatimonadales bacterium]